MAKSHPPYAPEFRHQIVELVRSGRTPEELSREFEPTAHAIRNWVRQAERDAGRRDDGFRRRSGPSWPVCAVRTASCVRSARSWQKRRPGSHEKPAR
jgi:transposase-like protein